jgi:hypothetical protein
MTTVTIVATYRPNGSARPASTDSRHRAACRHAPTGDGGGTNCRNRAYRRVPVFAALCQGPRAAKGDALDRKRGNAASKVGGGVGARTRTGTPCKAPAMPAGRCGMHCGGTGPRTAKGLERHPEGPDQGSFTLHWTHQERARSVMSFKDMDSLLCPQHPCPALRFMFTIQPSNHWIAASNVA